MSDSIWVIDPIIGKSFESTILCPPDPEPLCPVGEPRAKIKLAGSKAHSSTDSLKRILISFTLSGLGSMATGGNISSGAA